MIFLWRRRVTTPPFALGILSPCLSVWHKASHAPREARRDRRLARDETQRFAPLLTPEVVYADLTSQNFSGARNVESPFCAGVRLNLVFRHPCFPLLRARYHRPSSCSA